MFGRAPAILGLGPAMLQKQVDDESDEYGTVLRSRSSVSSFRPWLSLQFVHDDFFALLCFVTSVYLRCAISQAFQ